MYFIFLDVDSDDDFLNAISFNFCLKRLYCVPALSFFISSPPVDGSIVNWARIKYKKKIFLRRRCSHVSNYAMLLSESSSYTVHVKVALFICKS